MRTKNQRNKQQFMEKRDEKRQQKALAKNETDVEITTSESVQPEQFQEEPVIQDFTDIAYQDTEEAPSDQEPARASNDDIELNSDGDDDYLNYKDIGRA